MKQYNALLFIIFIPFFLTAQVDKTEDFYFSSIEEEIFELNKKALETGEDNPAEKLRLALKAYELSVAEDLFENQATALLSIGEAYFYLLELDKSLEYLNQSYELSKSLLYRDGHWNSAYKLGLLYSFLDDSQKAISFFTEADQLVNEENDIRHIIVNKELINLYKYSELYEEAISLASETLIKAEVLEDEQSILEITLLSGEIHFLAGEIRKANNLFKTITARTSSVSDFQTLRASAMSYMGKCYAILGDYHLALASGQNALLLSVKNDSGSGRIEAYDSLAFIYEYMKDFEKAYFNLQLYYKEKDIFENEKNSNNLSKIKAYYGTFEKEREIDKQQLQIRSQNRMILAGALMLGLFIILLIIFYLLYKKNLRTAARLSKELKQEMVLSKTDPVTGLPNRKDMEERIQNAIHAWHKEGRFFSIMFISLETYKKIDRDYGTGSGEMLQKFIGRKLTTELKGQDIVSIWKPFLFLVMLPDTDETGIILIKEKIIQKLKSEKYEQGDISMTLEIRYGHYTFKGIGNRSDCIDKCREELNLD